jgi:hypothetical protein
LAHTSVYAGISAGAADILLCRPGLWPITQERLDMKALLLAAVAMAALSAGTAAFAEEGGGNGENTQYFDPYSAPSGFYAMNPAYQAQQSHEAYVINQEQAWQVAHAGKQNPVAQATTPPHA